MDIITSLDLTYARGKRNWQMNNPPHPGEVLKTLWLEELNLTITATAKALNVSRVAISQIVNGRRGISHDMAFRLSKAFGTSPDLWMDLQRDFDFWKAKERSRSFLDSVEPLMS
ncbi:MAG: HigA family addiction module antitoxin [Cyclobacteriaceae bacterium]